MRRDISSLFELGAGTSVDRVYDVRAFGAIGDGTTDDTAAMQLTLDTCGGNGGGVVYVPPGTYLCNTTRTVSGAVIILEFRYDNVWLRGAGPQSKIQSTVGGQLFRINGAHKPGGLASWVANQYSQLTNYTINAASRDAMSVTTATAGHAGNLAAGDMVRIRTGQLVDGSNSTEPDAELNEVVSVNASTGVVTLKYPLLKDYAQEYFVSGTTGLTTRSVTANAAILAIQKVTAQTLHNIAITDIAAEQTGSSNNPSILSGAQVVGLTFDRLHLTSVNTIFSMGSFRFARITNNTAHIPTPRSGGQGDMFGAATGCSDVLISDNVMSCAGVCQTQLNEGTVNIKILRNVYLSKADAINAIPVITAFGRPRNHVYVDNTFINAGSGAVISVTPVSDDDVAGGSGMIVNNIIRGQPWTIAISCSARGWVLQPNLIDPASTYGTGGYFYTTARSLEKPTPSQVLVGWLDYATQNVVMGILPNHAYITGVHIWVMTAFNSDGTDQISIGYDASPGAFGALTDVSTTGIKTPTLANGGFQQSQWQVEAYYTNGGSEPSTGRAVCALEYFIAPVNP